MPAINIKIVIPAKAVIQNGLIILDSRLPWNDVLLFAPTPLPVVETL